MLEYRFKEFRTLLYAAKLALLEAREHGQYIRLGLYHKPTELLWGLSLEGEYPAVGDPTLYYDMRFTIQLGDVDIRDNDPQGKYLRALLGRDGVGVAGSIEAISKLGTTCLIAIDPASPPPVPTSLSYVHQVVKVG
jgi:hypothetical protein